MPENLNCIIEAISIYSGFHKNTLGSPCDIDARHEKTDFKVFVVVILKEGLAGWGPANLSLGMTPTTEYNIFIN